MPWMKTVQYICVQTTKRYGAIFNFARQWQILNLFNDADTNYVHTDLALCSNKEKQWPLDQNYTDRDYDFRTKIL